MTRTKEQMVEAFQCPGCVCGHNTECGKFKVKEMDAGGFACEGHVIGTMMFGGPTELSLILGLPKPFATLAREARTNHTLVLIGQEAGQKYIQPDDPMNIPVWKARHEGSTLVRIARPATGRFTTLVVDGDIDVPAPARDVGTDDGLL